MIINLFIQTIVLFFTAVFYFFPEVSIASIPWAGEWLSETLIDMVLIWNAFIITFPYAEIVWNMFLWVILPFEALMLLGRFFLGHRLPTNT